MFQVKLINPHKQFGKFNYSLIFHDTDGVFPDARWEKKYPDDVTKAQVATDVKRTLKAMAVQYNEQNPENPLTMEDAQLNGVEFSIDVKGGTKILGTL